MCSIGKVAAAALLFTLLGASGAQGALLDYQTAVLNTPSLISYYTFDNDPGGSGSTIADVDPNGTVHNARIADGSSPATLVGPPAALGGAGKSAYCSGSGTKNQVNVATVEDDFLFTDGSGTVELWFKPQDTSTRNLLGCVKQSGQWRWNIRVYTAASPGPGVGIGGGGADGVTSTYTMAPYTLNLNNWNHMAVVFKTGGVGVQVYMNGNKILDDDTYRMMTGYEDASHLTLGSTTYEGSNSRWKGWADEVSLYADPLDEATILAHRAALPEPATLSLLVAGGLFLARRRR